MRRALAPLAAVALSAAACAEIEPLEWTGLHEVMIGATFDDWCEPASDARVNGDGTDLMGPHFSVSLKCHYIGTEFPEAVIEDAPNLGELPPLIDGAEYLMVQFDDDPMLEPEAWDDGAFVSVEHEGGETALDHRKLAGNYLVVSVPAGAAAHVWFEDEGRTQGFDLRTALAVDPIERYYSDIRVGVHELNGYEYEEIRAWNDRRGWRLTCTSGHGEADRSVWVEERGWAPEGSAYLEVRFWWCGGKDDYEDMVWSLDPDLALTVWDGQDTLEPVDWREEDDDLHGVNVTALFEVPADVETFTIDFTPVGDLTGKSDGGDYTLIDKPKHTEWKVRF